MISVLEVLRHGDIAKFLLLCRSERVHGCVWRRWNRFDLGLGRRLPAERSRVEIPVVRGCLLIPISWEERIVVQRQGVGEDRLVAGLAPQSLCLAVGLDQLDLLCQRLTGGEI